MYKYLLFLIIVSVNLFAETKLPTGTYSSSDKQIIVTSEFDGTSFSQNYMIKHKLLSLKVNLSTSGKVKNVFYQGKKCSFRAKFNERELSKNVFLTVSDDLFMELILDNDEHDFYIILYSNGKMHTLKTNFTSTPSLKYSPSLLHFI